VNYLYWDFNMGPNDVVEVTLDKQANAFLVDSLNYSSYRNGRSFRYYGGLQKTSPVQLRPPRAGHWYLIVDLGGRSDQVNASAQLIKST